MGRRIDYQLLLLWSMLALAEFDASLPGAAAGANAAVSRLMYPPCSAVGSVATVSRQLRAAMNAASDESSEYESAEEAEALHPSTSEAVANTQPAASDAQTWAHELWMRT
eukprot:gene19778-26470_t